MLRKETFRIFTLIEAFAFALSLAGTFGGCSSLIQILGWCSWYAGRELHLASRHAEDAGWRADNLGPRLAKLPWFLVFASRRWRGRTVSRSGSPVPAHFLNSHRFFGYFSFLLIAADRAEFVFDGPPALRGGTTDGCCAVR